MRARDAEPPSATAVFTVTTAQGTQCWDAWHATVEFADLVLFETLSETHRALTAGGRLLAQEAVVLCMLSTTQLHTIVGARSATSLKPP